MMALIPSDCGALRSFAFEPDPGTFPPMVYDQFAWPKAGDATATAKERRAAAAVRVWWWWRAPRLSISRPRPGWRAHSQSHRAEATRVCLGSHRRTATRSGRTAST